MAMVQRFLDKISSILSLAPGPLVSQAFLAKIRTVIVVLPAVYFALLGLGVLLFPEYLHLFIGTFFISFALCVGLVSLKAMALKRKLLSIASQIEAKLIIEASRNNKSGEEALSNRRSRDTEELINIHSTDATKKVIFH